MQSISAETRTVIGKSLKSLRNKGMLPAVVYGKGKKSISISVSYAEFLRVWHKAGESSLVLLKTNDGQHNALIHDVALDPIKNNPVHADFYLVDMTKEIEVNIPLEFTGEESAGKASGGVLVKVLHELRISALPHNLPPTFVVDVSVLQNFKDALHVQDIVSPAGVTLLNEQNEMVAFIEEIVAPEPEVAVEESAQEAIQNIEVIKPEKKEEEPAEAEAA